MAGNREAHRLGEENKDFWDGPNSRDARELEESFDEVTQVPEVVLPYPLGPYGPGPEGARRIREARRQRAEVQSQIDAAYERGFQDGVRSLGEQAVKGFEE
jgi:hypothetical protein